MEMGVYKKGIAYTQQLYILNFVQCIDIWTMNVVNGFPNIEESIRS